jgi:hypothetical protein
MSLSDLAAVGSFVSGIAVVFSILFLALQVRQANRNQRSLIQQGRTARNVDILLRMSDPFMSETIAEADVNCAGMSAVKIWSFYGFAGAVFWTYEDSFLQFQANTLNASSWESDAVIIKRLMGHPAYRVAWKMARDGMGGGYRDYVDTLMREVRVDTSQSLTDLFRTYVAQELPMTSPERMPI